MMLCLECLVVALVVVALVVAAVVVVAITLGLIAVYRNHVSASQSRLER